MVLKYNYYWQNICVKIKTLFFKLLFIVEKKQYLPGNCCDYRALFYNYRILRNDDLALCLYRSAAGKHK